MMVILMTRTTREVKHWTLLGMWRLLTIASNVLVVESCNPKDLVATTSIQALIYNGSTEPHCAWVIRAENDGDVIGVRVIDWITPSRFSCSRDRLIIRDGAHSSSPALRVLCGAMCGILNEETEVVTSANYMRVSYVPLDASILQNRGFTLVYRSLTIHPVKQQTAMYTGVNYVLMCASVVVIGGLTIVLVYLFLRELGLLHLKKRQQRIDKLKRRRPAFSGQSGLQGSRRGWRHQSTTEVVPVGWGLQQSRTEVVQVAWGQHQQQTAAENAAEVGLVPMDLSPSPAAQYDTTQYLSTMPTDCTQETLVEEIVNDDVDTDFENCPPSDDRAQQDVVTTGMCSQNHAPDDIINHVHGNGQVISLLMDKTHGQCNGKTIMSPVKRSENHGVQDVGRCYSVITDVVTQ